MKKDLLTILDLNREEILDLIDAGLKVKSEERRVTGAYGGYTLGLIFDKASTRTRVSFETAMFRLGGHTLFLSKGDTQMARNEELKDTVRVLSRYLDALVVRTYAQEDLEEMARWSDIPIINALTDLYHPCQVLSDLMTIKEKRGHFEDLKIAWIGDGNNVANSWVNACHILGIDLVLACPPGYHPHPDALKGVGRNIRVVEDPREAVRDADVINTDVWASMGQEDEKNQRRKDFQSYQVNQSLLKAGREDALVMHCLPAHRGEEITSEVLDGPNSIVLDQAENKLHLHQALLQKLIVLK
jgi:ornithine carbamoyltransferase